MPTFNIARYSSIVRSERHNKAQAEILLYDKKDCLMGQLFFMATGENTKPSSCNGGVIRIFYPVDAYLMAIDMLRNECPVKIQYDNPKVAFITATLQQICKNNFDIQSI